MKVKSDSEVAQSCPTLRDPMDCSPPGSLVHGIFQARGLEWGAIAFSESKEDKVIIKSSAWAFYSVTSDKKMTQGLRKITWDY